MGGRSDFGGWCKRAELIGKLFSVGLLLLGFVACAGTGSLALKDEPLKAVSIRGAASQASLRPALNRRQDACSVGSRADATLPPQSEAACAAQPRPAIMGSVERQRPVGSPQTPETKGLEPEPPSPIYDEPPEVSVTETPGGGLSKPLSELPPARPPMIHPEPKVDEEALAERQAEIPSASPGTFAVQYADSEAPSRLLTDDPALDQERAEGAPAPGTPPVAFADADDNNTGQPPDTDMDVSDNYVVTDYNSIVKVYDKAGNLLAGPVDIQSIFGSTGTMTNCGATETTTSWLSDPQVRYDEESQRWFLSMLRITGGGTGSYLCLACSQGLDPRGSWRGWEYNVGATRIADYPHLGVGQDAAFIGENFFNGTTGAYIRSNVTAITPKANLLNGGALTWTRASMAGNNGYAPQPVKRHGYGVSGQWPPSGTAHYILAVNGNTNVGQVWRWSYPTASGSLSFVSEPGFAYVGAATYPGSSTYVANSTQKIDPLDTRWMDAEMRWPNIWSARTLGNPSDTTCHGAAYNALPGSGKACDLLQWGQMDVSSGTPSIVQQGNYAVAGNHLFCPDVAVDKSNNFAVGYTYVKDTGASGPTFVSAYLSGRESTDTLGTLAGPLSSADGDVKLNTYDQGTSPSDRMRWGDYLSMAIDPNGCDIWFNGMRAKGGLGATYNDQTYVQKFHFASCSSGATIFGSLDKGNYGCADTVRGTITDTGGAPSNAVYHSTTGGAVAAAITGGPNAYTVTPATVGQLGAASGDKVWLTFTGSDSSTHSSVNSSVKCGYKICLYKVDAPAGGCDGDPYIDSGETVGLNIALANYDTLLVPAPFVATLSLSVANPNVQIYDRATGTWGTSGTMTYSTSLGPNTYAYGDYPFLVKYTGPIGTTVGTDCRVTLNFQLVNIQDANGGWSSSGCTAGSNLFTELANANPSLGTTTFSESFDSTTFPPTGWADFNWSAAVNWARSTGSGAGGHPPNVSSHTGAGMAWYDSYTAAAGTYALLYRTSASTIPSSSPIMSFWMYHDSGSAASNDYIQVWTSPNGTNWYAFGSPIYRVNGISGWENHLVDLSSIAGQSLYLGFMATSAHGNGIFIDDVALASLGTPTCQVSTCSPAPSLLYSQYSWLDGNCNNSGVIDPGESGLLTLFLANMGNDWAYGTTATLTCPACPANWGTICTSTATYGDIPYGTSYVYGPGSNGFEIAVNSGVACGTTLPFVVTASSTNPYGPVALATTSYPVKVGGTAGSCTATSCTGSCAAPGAPVITAIYDNAPCVQNGIKVNYTAGILATSHDLYKDGGLAVTGYVSGVLYNPGDSASHSYVVRAINAYGGTNSTAVAFADAAAPVASITGASANVCPATTVTLSTDAGHSNYQWYVGGSPIGGATASSYVVSASGSYTVTYTLGGCTATSSAKMVTITCCTGPTAMTTSAVDHDPFAYSGIDVSWPDPTSWGDGGFNTAGRGFNVWRNTVPPGSPLKLTASPLAAGVHAYTDLSPAHDTPYTYYVEAINGCGVSATYASSAQVQDGAACMLPTFVSADPNPSTVGAASGQILLVSNPAGSAVPYAFAFTWDVAFTLNAFSADPDGILGFWQTMAPYTVPFVASASYQIIRRDASHAFVDINGNGTYDAGTDYDVLLAGQVISVTRAVTPGTVESQATGYRLILQDSLFVNPPDQGSYPVQTGLTASCGSWSATQNEIMGASPAGCPPTTPVGTTLTVTKSGSQITIAWPAPPADPCMVGYAVFASTNPTAWSYWAPISGQDLDMNTTNPQFVVGIGLNLTYYLVAEVGGGGQLGPLGAYGQ